MRLVPAIDARLKFVPVRQQITIARGEVGNDGGKTGPESVQVQARPRQRRVLYERIDLRCNLQSAAFNAFRHLRPSSLTGSDKNGPQL